MPELPEVETIVRSLRNPESNRNSEGGLIGKIITSSQVLWERSLAVPSQQEFQSQIIGQQINEVERRAKFILLRLSDLTLLFHLRMSGDLFLEQGISERDQKHDRIRLYFSDGSRLVFNDPRKFGRAWLVADPLSVVGGLGPEPLEEALTADLFFEKLQRQKRQIKPLLLDQRFLAGLGNIYTDEALFQAGIHPATAANRIQRAQANGLLIAIRQVLLEGIRRNGASIDWVYRGGDFQNHFQVYQRDGQPCYRCGEIIRRTTLGQRGTHFCPRCQPPDS